MTADELVAAPDLPAPARVDRRVPKSLLIGNGAPTAADRSRVADGIEQIRWVAGMKPASVGAAAWRDEIREGVEIAVRRQQVKDTHVGARQGPEGVRQPASIDGGGHRNAMAEERGTSPCPHVPAAGDRTDFVAISTA